MPTPIKGTISGSRGAGILGLNKYKSIFSAWLEIMEQIEPGFCLNNGYELPVRLSEWEEPLNPKMDAIRWGHAFEDSICDLVGGITNREDTFTHPKYNFITCHIDGLKDGVLVENKTAFDMAFKMGWGEPGTDMIPKEYMIQVQHNMMLTGCKEALVNVLVFPKPPAEWEKQGFKINSDGDMTKNGLPYSDAEEFTNNLANLGYFHQYHIKADIELQGEILKRYLNFWNNHILTKTEPPINGYDDIKWLFASPEGEIEATEEMKSLWSEKCDIENEIDDMIKRVQECKNNFAQLVQIEKNKLNIKPGNEPRKLNIYSGRRKLASVTKAYPRVSVKKDMVTHIKDNNPDMYESMKKTTFLDLLGNELSLTEKQQEKLKDIEKFLKSLKLTKLLEKKSIFSVMKNNKPEMYKFFSDNSIIEETSPKSSLRMTKNSEE